MVVVLTLLRNPAGTLGCVEGFDTTLRGGHFFFAGGGGATGLSVFLFPSTFCLLGLSNTPGDNRMRSEHLFVSTLLITRLW